MKARPLSSRTLGVLVAVVLLSTSSQGLAQEPRVAFLVDDSAGSFSPEGKTIVFTRHFSTLLYGLDTHPVPSRSVLITMRADGSRKRVLRQLGVRFEYDPSFSPDGLSILSVRDDRIYVMRRDGSGAYQVRRDSLEQACPRFSPDGSKISFWRGRPGAKPGAYYVMNADGGGLRRIVNARDRFAWGCPSWFPNGQRIAFAKDYNLYVSSADGTNVKQITDDKDGTFYSPAVSPDGDWIACHGTDSRYRSGIIRMRADGTGITRITVSRKGLEGDGGASWSPDGRRILFTGHHGRFEGAGVYVVNRDGSGLRRLSNIPG